jgi:hypothetical protein
MVLYNKDSTVQKQDKVLSEESVRANENCQLIDQHPAPPLVEESIQPQVDVGLPSSARDETSRERLREF